MNDGIVVTVGVAASEGSGSCGEVLDASFAVTVVVHDEFQGCLYSVLLMTMIAVGSVFVIRDCMATFVMRKRDWWTGRSSAVIFTYS